MPERSRAAGQDQPPRMRGFRHALHTRASARSNHGFLGGSLCSLRSLSPGGGAESRIDSPVTMPAPLEFNPACPFPLQDYPNVLMAHGGGGRLMHQLISEMFLPAFRNPLTEPQHDACVFELGGQRLALTTDSYVVRPLFFPGGDLGSLAVHGTVNDLAMAGARPLYLTAAFIIEEGLPMETLWKIASSMQAAAAAAGVQIITGDTKVVDKGKADGLFINTAGVGVLEHAQNIAPQSVRPNDAILVSGDVGRHGMAVMA